MKFNNFINNIIYYEYASNLTKYIPKNKRNIFLYRVKIHLFDFMIFGNLSGFTQLHEVPRRYISVKLLP